MSIFEEVNQIINEMNRCVWCGELCLPEDDKRGICILCEVEANLESAYCNDDVAAIRKYEWQLEEMRAQ